MSCVGLGWLALTVSFELGIGHVVFHRSGEALASDYNISHGGVLPIGLILLALSLLIAADLSGLGKAANVAGPPEGRA